MAWEERESTNIFVPRHLLLLEALLTSEIRSVSLVKPDLTELHYCHQLPFINVSRPKWVMNHRMQRAPYIRKKRQKSLSGFKTYSSYSLCHLKRQV